MKTLSEHITEKLIINKDYKSCSGFDELISIIEKLRSHGEYITIVPHYDFNIDEPEDKLNKIKVREIFKKMERCLIYNYRICDQPLYTDIFNKVVHFVNHNKNDLNIIWSEWDAWGKNGYARHFTIIDNDDLVLMVVNANDDIDDTYILVGYRK